MYKINHFISLIALTCFIMLAVGSIDDDNSAGGSTNDNNSKDKSNSPSSSSKSSYLKESNPDVCRCLTEPGNTEWYKANDKTCTDAISSRIGVPNWEEVNFSQNPILNDRWDRLKASCGY